MQVKIPRKLIDEIGAHALDDAPNECCGQIGAVEGQPTSVYRARNAFESPMRFDIHGEDLIRIHREMDERGEELLASYHSHPHSEARPSETDINIARTTLAGELWVICSLQTGDPVVRMWRIGAGSVEEIELVVE
ncbi:MAG TPA: M67 family metallopeptidase [Solirubrobacterales bacterium]|nr:M67 family metallopeptidase [Solirubrobacterales bacterium]